MFTSGFKLYLFKSIIELELVEVFYYTRSIFQVLPLLYNKERLVSLTALFFICFRAVCCRVGTVSCGLGQFRIMSKAVAADVCV